MKKYLALLIATVFILNGTAYGHAVTLAKRKETIVKHVNTAVSKVEEKKEDKQAQFQSSKSIAKMDIKDIVQEEAKENLKMKIGENGEAVIGEEIDENKDAVKENLEADESEKVYEAEKSIKTEVTNR